jgi:hypothetical protein
MQLCPPNRNALRVGDSQPYKCQALGVASLMPGPVALFRSNIDYSARGDTLLLPFRQ